MIRLTTKDRLIYQNDEILKVSFIHPNLLEITLSRCLKEGCFRVNYINLKTLRDLCYSV